MRMPLLLLLPLFLVAPLGWSADPPRPRIASPAPVKDLGQILHGTVTEHVFVLENRGDGPLDIKEVLPTCDCTKVPPTRQTLQPGESLSLKVSLDSTKLKGPIARIILVSTNDPDRPFFNLELRGIVSTLYALDPESIRFQPIGRNMDWTRKLTLARTDGKPFQVQSVQVKGDTAFHARFTRRPGAEAGDIQLDYRPGAEPRAVDAVLEVVLDDPLQPILEVPIRGQIIQDLGTFPQRLDFLSIQPGDLLPQRVLLTFHNPGVEFRSITAEPDIFTFQTVPRRSLPSKASRKPGAGEADSPTAKGLEIQVQVKAGTPPGSFRGKILLRTNCIDQDRIEIPFQGTVAGG